MELKDINKKNRRSPVIIKAYESMEHHHSNVRLLGGQSSMNIEKPSQQYSQDMVHIVSVKELHSHHESRQKVRVSVEQVENSPAADTHGR